MTTANVRADCWGQSLAAYWMQLASRPLVEHLYRSRVFNCAEIKVEQESFGPWLNGSGWTLEDCLRNQRPSWAVGASTWDMIQAAQELGAGLMINHDTAGFLSPGNRVRYIDVAEDLARLLKPRFWVILNEPTGKWENEQYRQLVIDATAAVRRGSPETVVIADGHLDDWMGEPGLRDVVAEFHSWEWSPGEIFSFYGHSDPLGVTRFGACVGQIRRRYPGREIFLGEMNANGYLPRGTTHDDAAKRVSLVHESLLHLGVGYAHLVIGGADEALQANGRALSLIDLTDGVASYTNAGLAMIQFAKDNGYYREWPEPEPEDEVMTRERLQAVLRKLEAAEDRWPTPIRQLMATEADRRNERNARRKVAAAAEMIEAALEVAG